MVNENHLEMLEKGVEAWNRWRNENSIIMPDLSEADLNRADLLGANLLGANLSGANLNRANLHLADLRVVDLSRAYLGEANLSGADLSRAYLSQASSSGANLSEANLIGMDLSHADLREASLVEANLRGAHLSHADLREANLVEADLRGADLRKANLCEANLVEVDLRKANLVEADLRKANLHEANLVEADLSEANLSHADLRKANLRGANLRGAGLSGADLCEANLNGADFRGSHLRGANLNQAILIKTNFLGADLSNCSVYGIAAWSLNLEGANQSSLVITPPNESAITVDNLEVAQFIYLLLHNEKIRHIIDTITSKVVLILGRFTPERKAVLDAIRDELRQRDYLPILFDFEKPSNRDVTETISTLAHIARFVVADITDAKSVPQELERIVPGLPSVPVQPLIASSDYEYGMFEHFRHYPWVLDAYQYESIENLIASLKERVIDPAEMKANERTKLASSVLLSGPQPNLKASEA